MYFSMPSLESELTPGAPYLVSLSLFSMARAWASSPSARAMIAAAYADGHIDETERQKIFAQVETMELTVNEKAMLFDELRKPMTLSELVQSVPDAQTGIEVYAASVSAIDLNQPISGQYLEALANQLCLPRELVQSIHHQLTIQA